MKKMYISIPLYLILCSYTYTMENYYMEAGYLDTINQVAQLEKKIEYIQTNRAYTELKKQSSSPCCYIAGGTILGTALLANSIALLTAPDQADILYAIASSIGLTIAGFASGLTLGTAYTTKVVHALEKKKIKLKKKLEKEGIFEEALDDQTRYAQIFDEYEKRYIQLVEYQNNMRNTEDTIQ